MIETNDNTIIISDFSNAITKKSIDSDDENEENVLMKKSEIADAEITQSKTKILKEVSLIDEKLKKLQNQKKALELTNTKKKKNLIKSRTASKNSKSTRKFHIKETKTKNKKKSMKNR